MVIVIVGASASGKTTLLKEFIKQGCERVITNTTRSRRPDDGENAYHFLTEKEFKTKIERGEMLEYATYNNNLYGTSIDSITENCAVVVEPNGLYALKKALNCQMYSIYVKVDEDVRRSRTVERGGVLADFESRLEGDRLLFNAKLEADVDCVLDTPTLEDYALVVQKCLEQSK